MKTKIEEKLAMFAALVGVETLAQMDKDYPGRTCNAQSSKTHYHMGRKFARVDVGSSGKYMVDLETEEIFGIKAYGVVHRGYRFGTLDTVQDWFWGRYRAGLKQIAPTTPTGNIFWKDAIAEHREIFEKNNHFETRDGAVIYWHGNESAAAQIALRDQARVTLADATG